MGEKFWGSMTIHLTTSLREPKIFREIYHRNSEIRIFDAEIIFSGQKNQKKRKNIEAKILHFTLRITLRF